MPVTLVYKFKESNDLNQGFICSDFLQILGGELPCVIVRVPTKFREAVFESNVVSDYDLRRAKSDLVLNHTLKNKTGRDEMLLLRKKIEVILSRLNIRQNNVFFRKFRRTRSP